VYARITGYFEATQQFNPGKVEEFNDRKYFELKDKRETKT